MPGGEELKKGSFFNILDSQGLSLHLKLHPLVNLADKVVIITGDSSGIGEHLAYEYGKRGARLALSARRENAQGKLQIEIEILDLRMLL